VAASVAAVALGAFASGCKKPEGSPTALSSDAPAASTAEVATAPSASGSAEAEPPPPTTWEPPVDLRGKAHAAPAIPEGAPRLVSIAMLTEVRARPSSLATKIGYLRAGAVVEIDPSESPKKDDKCAQGFRKIKPYGFVCIGPEATLDVNHPIARVRATRDREREDRRIVNTRIGGW
jgi:hypothetical protein